MKRNIHTHILLGALLVWACNPEKQPEQIYLTDVHATLTDLSKAQLDPASGKYSWEDGDELLVFNGKGSATFRYAGSDLFHTDVADFEISDSYQFLYPASLYDPSCSQNGNIGIVFPSQQSYDGTMVRSGILYGTSTTADVKMRDLTATVELKIPDNVSMEKAVLTSGSAPCAGNAVISNGRLSLSLTSASNTITVTATAKSPLSSVYFSLPPKIYPGGLSVDITTSSGELLSYTTEGIVSVNPGLINVKDLVTPAAIFEGKGTQESPFLIRNTEDFLKFSEMVKGDDTREEYSDKYYLLAANLDFSGIDIAPVGPSSSAPFKGVFDGNDCTISGFTLNNTASTPSGLFAYVKNATIKNLRMEKVDVNSDYVYSAVVAGSVENSTLENIAVDGTFRAYGTKIVVGASEYAPVETNNAAYNGTIAGLVQTSTVRNCTFSGTATIYGKFGGGLIGVANNSVIENCAVTKGSMVHVYYHFSGGLIGRAIGADNLIKACSFEGHFSSTGYCNGGIVGQLLGGKVTECVLGSNGYVGGDKYFVGGIVGSAQPLSDIEISRCASYGEVRGAYSVAGICGYGGPGTGISSDKDLILSASRKLVIRECGMCDGLITATSGNSNNYPIAAGVIGWTHGSISYALQSCFSMAGTVQTTYGANVNGVLSGISAYQNSNGGATIENCYSAFELGNFLICYDGLTNENLWYAAVAIRCTGKTDMANCFSSTGLRTTFSNGSSFTETGCEQLSQTQMTDGTLLAKLNSTGGGVVWVAGPNNYPVPQGLPSDPNPKKKASKRVSVIGDSISTFRGIIPGGYSAHYPAADGTLTLARETYWWRLIYDYMKDAELDVNIAFSGSTVTNTTYSNMVSRYGQKDEATMAKDNAWWHNSFCERFAACGGMGNPDIILIHGGTNDWAHNADPLAPGIAIRNDSGNIYGGSAPSESVMNSIYAVADAAKTRAEVNALPDGTFCQAYVKLLCQIRQKYPQCKVVCIIGDYLSQSVEQSVLQIAAHYGAKTVNLFRVNGFNDLGGYSPSTLTGLGRPQPNMPKHDHTDLYSAGGCHPGSECMKFMATKIYNELGAWLEE